MTLRLSAVLIALTIMVGCSTGTNEPSGATAPEKPAVKQPTLYTAKDCFGSMLNLAKRWDPGSMPFHMESEANAEATGQDGKATVWHGYFASRTRGTMKTVTCSGSYLPGAPARGFTDAPETPYASNIPTLMFDASLFLTDSDKAFAATLDHGGSALIKKDPKQPVIFSLDWDPRKKEVRWTVIYGKTLADREGLAVVDARTGAFLSAGK